MTDTPETPCLRAHRLRLRQALARDLDIQWGKRAQRIEEGEDKVTVWFEDGTHAEGTILVGADGTFSAGLCSPSSHDYGDEMDMDGEMADYQHSPPTCSAETQLGGLGDLDLFDTHYGRVSA